MPRLRSRKCQMSIEMILGFFSSLLTHDPLEVSGFTQPTCTMSRCWFRCWSIYLCVPKWGVVKWHNFVSGITWQTQCYIPPRLGMICQGPRSWSVDRMVYSCRSGVPCDDDEENGSVSHLQKKPPGIFHIPGIGGHCWPMALIRSMRINNSLAMFSRFPGSLNCINPASEAVLSPKKSAAVSWLHHPHVTFAAWMNMFLTSRSPKSPHSKSGQDIPRMIQWQNPQGEMWCLVPECINYDLTYFRQQGSVNVLMFHITQILRIVYLQQILLQVMWNKSPILWTFTKPWSIWAWLAT